MDIEKLHEIFLRGAEEDPAAAATEAAAAAPKAARRRRRRKAGECSAAAAASSGRLAGSEGGYGTLSALGLRRAARVKRLVDAFRLRSGQLSTAQADRLLASVAGSRDPLQPGRASAGRRLRAKVRRLLPN